MLPLLLLLLSDLGQPLLLLGLLLGFLPLRNVLLTLVELRLALVLLLLFLILLLLRLVLFGLLLVKLLLQRILFSFLLLQLFLEVLDAVQLLAELVNLMLQLVVLFLLRSQLPLQFLVLAALRRIRAHVANGERHDGNENDDDPPFPRAWLLGFLRMLSTADTLRQARLGLSRIRRMAIIVAASFGCFARDLARIATTQVPTTFTMAKPRKKTPKMMA